MTYRYYNAQNKIIETDNIHNLDDFVWCCENNLCRLYIYYKYWEKFRDDCKQMPCPGCKQKGLRLWDIWM